MLNNTCRIAILSVHSSPLGQPGVGDTGGMSIYIRELAKSLAKRGHVIDIFTRAQDPVTPEIIRMAPGVRLIQIRSGEPADIHKMQVYLYAPDFAIKTETFCLKNNLSYDVIFSHYWISGIAGEYLQSRWNIPHMIMFHTLGAIKNAIGIGENEPPIRLQEESRVARSCQKIIASTATERLALEKFYDVSGEKVSIVPCGVNLDLFHPANKAEARQKLGLEDGKIILFVGRIERLKGIDKIIRALPYLKDINPKLLVVGEDGNRPGEVDNLKSLSIKIGAAESVIFTGLIDYEKLPDFYNAADVCAFPSYYESFGLVPLESLACGTPVVATDVGDLKRIIREGETGFVVPDSDPQRLAEKMGQILRGTAPGIQGAAAIRVSVNSYGWTAVADSICKEICKIIQNNQVPA